MIGAWSDARAMSGLSPCGTVICDTLVAMGFLIERVEELPSLLFDGKTDFHAIAGCPCGTGSSYVSMRFGDACDPVDIARNVRALMGEHIAEDIARGALPVGFGQ